MITVNIVAISVTVGNRVEIHHTRCPSASRVPTNAENGAYWVPNRKGALRAVQREDEADSVIWAPCVAQLPDTGTGKRHLIDPPHVPRPLSTGNPGVELSSIADVDMISGTAELHRLSGGWAVVESIEDNASVTLTDFGTDEQGARNYLCSLRY